MRKRRASVCGRCGTVSSFTMRRTSPTCAATACAEVFNGPWPVPCAIWNSQRSAQPAARHPARALGAVAILEFATEVDGRQVDGIDKLTFDEDGLITELKVMIRPASALQLVGAKMAEEFPRVGLGLPS